ncbi:hypothetical protein QBC44DRAFT_367573 [Cladorrhinum sp. PSN332]|nr:hypothetical protein QBC44DRAFT_367573 [Cladorrhinum sp. PSN332]
MGAHASFLYTQMIRHQKVDGVYDSSSTCSTCNGTTPNTPKRPNSSSSYSLKHHPEKHLEYFKKLVQLERDYRHELDVGLFTTRPGPPPPPPFDLTGHSSKITKERYDEIWYELHQVAGEVVMMENQDESLGPSSRKTWPWETPCEPMFEDGPGFLKRWMDDYTFGLSGRRKAIKKRYKQRRKDLYQEYYGAHSQWAPPPPHNPPPYPALVCQCIPCGRCGGTGCVTHDRAASKEE